MPISNLIPADLRFNIIPESSGFLILQSCNTIHSLDWAERRKWPPDSGWGWISPTIIYLYWARWKRSSSLLRQAMEAAASSKALPPDLCYLHNFDAPERPQALFLLPGQGRLLRNLLAHLVKSIQSEIPRCLEGQEFKAESERD